MKRVLHVGVALCAALGASADLPQIVATVGGRPISRERLEEAAAGELAQLERERAAALESALDRLVQRELLAREAARRGIETDELVAEEVAAKVAPVTQHDIEQWASANRQRMRGSLEQMADPIRRYLTEERAQRELSRLVGELRQRYRVDLLLPAYRHELDVSGAPYRGHPEAPVTLVEFSDFQCPYCSKLRPALAELEERYAGRLKVVFLQLPLTSIHPQAEKAAEAALCAARQGRFWELHDVLFDNQRQLGEDELAGHAAIAGLDVDVFETCLEAGEARPQLEREMAEARRLGLSGTPSLLVNGRPLTLDGRRPPVEQIGELIEDELRRMGSS